MACRRWLCGVAIPIVLAVVGGPSEAANVAVCATGDSLTRGYANSYLQASFNTAGFPATVTRIATIGVNTTQYRGLAPDPYDDLRDYIAEVIAADPDVILLMMGTNDVLGHRYEATMFDTFTQNMTAILDRYGAVTNGRGFRPLLVLATMPPVLPFGLGGPDDVAGQWITDQMNPWIRAEAAARGLTLFDTYDLITSQPSWQALYSTDGVHLYAQSSKGYKLLADEFAATTMSIIPEPTTFALVAIGTAAILRRRRSGRRLLRAV